MQSYMRKKIQRSVMWLVELCHQKSSQRGRGRKRKQFSSDQTAEVLDQRILMSAAPQGVVDGVNGAGVVHGWAFDRDSPGQGTRLHIYVDGKHAGSTVTQFARGDVNRAFGVPGNNGYRWNIPNQYRDGNVHSLAVYAIDPQRIQNTRLVGATTSFRMPALHAPQGVVDGVSNSGVLHGWAFDRDSPGQSTRLHIYIDGEHAASTTTRYGRGDVNRALGVSGNNGFIWHLPNRYRDGASHSLAVYALDPQGVRHTRLTGSTTSFRLPALHAPQGVVDGVSNSGVVHGWALDRDSPGQNVRLHVYVDGQHVDSITTQHARRDVNNATGVPGNHGFRWTIPEQYRTGSHRIDVYAIDPQAVQNASLIRSGITIQPEIVIDGVNETNPVPISIGDSVTNGQTVERTFTIRNTGTSTLTVSGVTLPLRHADAAKFRVTRQPASAILPGESTTFTISLIDSQVSGTFATQVQLTSNDENERTIGIPITATVLYSGPHVEVSGVRDGQLSLVSVGTGGQYGRPLVRTFTIRNTGDELLTLGAVNVSEPGRFRIIRQPASALRPGESTQFTVSLYRTSESGRFEAVVMFETGQPDRPRFSFSVTGRIRSSVPSPMDGDTTGQVSASQVAAAMSSNALWTALYLR